eukprot:CAMPEP_0184688236 /NCGR_PEP_ID=MMETSP0312-20130426/29077_1 /TAXON_ID=31354 /ORGANISM="Compsopogon coeruleus, Strain SAG 36.94" /LENGTH=33 /DNA_ID= /DNA_START= /DNA_END= /DNA_ORIENTATION=
MERRPNKDVGRLSVARMSGVEFNHVADSDHRDD